MEAMLAELFGVGWVNLLSNGVDDNSFGSVLGLLFGLFNAAVALVTVGVLFMVAVTAIADTAQSGQVMGRNSSLWVPVRAVLAATLLVPVVKGFSLLQVLILSLVVNFSVTLANTMASEAVSSIVQNGIGFSDPVAAQVHGVAEQVLFSSVCQNYYNTIEYDPGQGAGGQIVEAQSVEIANGLRRVRWSFNGDAYSGQGEAACGAYFVTCPDQDADTLTMCDEQLASLKQLKLELDPIALSIIASQSASSIEVARASLRYQERQSQVLKKRMAKVAFDQQHTAARNELIEAIDSKGFAFLGQWYMTLAALNHKNQSYAKATLDSLPIDQSKAIQHRIGVFAYLERTQSMLRVKSEALSLTAGRLSEDAKRQREIGGVLGGEGTLGNYLASHSELNLVGEGTDASTLFNFDTDPLTGLQQLGSTMVTLTTAFWSESRMQGAKLKRSDQDEQVTQMIMRASNTLNFKKDPQQSYEGQLETFASYIMIILFLAGLTLMYYLPAVPFILWTMGVVGYLVLVLESLIAAPLWAASHALPKGQGLSSDASRHGYILLLNLAIRPPLMVLGLLAGGALMALAAKFAVATFDIYSASLLESRVEISSLLTFVTLFVVEVIIVIGLVHKSLALIYETSDKAVEWVTGASRTGSDAGDAQRASGSASGAQRSGEAALGRASYSARAGGAVGAAGGTDPAANQTLR